MQPPAFVRRRSRLRRWPRKGVHVMRTAAVIPFTNSSRVLQRCLRPRAVACSACAKSAMSTLAAAHRSAMGESARAVARASSNCHSYSAKVAPASAVLAHIRSAASAPRAPTNRPAQSLQASISRISRLTFLRDRDVMAACSCCLKECSKARRNNSSLFANDRYKPCRDTPAARATSSIEVLR